MVSESDCHRWRSSDSAAAAEHHYNDPMSHQRRAATPGGTSTRCVAVLAGAAIIGGPLIAVAQSGWQANPEVVAREAKSRTASNFDETRVGTFTLPDPLTLDGRTVRSLDEWTPRRSQILDLFQDHVYGRSPGKPASLRFERLEEQAGAMDGAATLTRVSIISSQAGREHRFGLVVFLPNRRTTPVPLFLLLNNRPPSGIDPTRKERSEFWPAEDLIARGYGIAAVHNVEVAPDNAKTFRDGIIRFFDPDGSGPPGEHEWGAISAWAWGGSRAMDYFETDARIDRTRVAVVGHSRGGKTALWAGAQDERFALVIPNESGEGGASLARRDFGETIAQINRSFSHWFTGRFKTYNGRPEALPVDQHMLVALVAPRAVYVASADEDLWADPRGEFLSLVHASPVFALYGDPHVAPEAMPPLSQPLIVGRRGYHIRPGTHALTAYDWQRFADFADRLWKK
jgi:hypothetical protein